METIVLIAITVLAIIALLIGEIGYYKSITLRQVKRIGKLEGLLQKSRRHNAHNEAHKEK
jgi:uncharacterized membrane protein